MSGVFVVDSMVLVVFWSGDSSVDCFCGGSGGVGVRVVVVELMVLVVFMVEIVLLVVFAVGW